jgi:hypothetical protein
VPAAMADNSMALLSFLPNTTYDLPTYWEIVVMK